MSDSLTNSSSNQSVQPGGVHGLLNGKELMGGMKLYLLAFLSLLPGALLGSSVLVVWYLAAGILFAQKRADRLIIVFIIWNFLNRGAYHYGLLGDNEGDVLLRIFNPFVLVLLIGLYVSGSKHYEVQLMRYERIGLLLSLIALASGIVNGIGFGTFVEYYAIFFRWLIFAALLWNLALPNRFYRRLVYLLVGITTINSMLGTIQQFILPLQVTPSGYIPDPLDVASGLFGVTYSQHLSVLCLAFASFYIFRFLQAGGSRNILMVFLLLLQPFSASSKFALFMSLGLFLLSLTILYFRSSRRQSFLSIVPKLGLVVILALIGFQVYDYTNREDFGSPLDPLRDYFGSVSSLEDLQKLMGYAIAFTEVAPSGVLGPSLGVGPTRFLNTLDGGQTEYSSGLAIGDEVQDLSSLHKQNTEMVATIGELGWMGFVTMLFLMGSMGFAAGRSISTIHEPARIAFSLLTFQFILAVIALTFYLQGWAVAFYYIPLSIFVAYDRKCL